MKNQIKYPEVKVKLLGNDGNAFAILSACKYQAMKEGLNQKHIKEFMDEAVAKDYDHLLQTCMKYFEIN